jgi:thiamine-monophosphate kinase
MKEFSIIEEFFRAGALTSRADVVCGIGDDAALLEVPPQQTLAVTTDTLVSGVHFFADVDPGDLAHKALAVNLSDLAAMGAQPAWISLALTLPKTSPDWLHAFAERLHEQCQYYGVALIGGDTTSGPLSITITAHGFVPVDSALKRSGAQPGDTLYVTGTLGDAAAGLACLQGKLAVSAEQQHALVGRLLRPTPRVLAGTYLRRIASSCLDLSDGLAGDIQHICHASNVGVEIQVDRMPLSKALVQAVAPEQAYQFALTGGDDYELCFSAPPSARDQLSHALQTAGVCYTEIGTITGSPGIYYTLNGEPFELSADAYQHQFA